MKEYKVIEIIDAYNLIINYGLERNAKQGDRLRIVDRGEEVKDPDTGEILGTLDAIKAVVSVKNAYNKFSVCHKIKTPDLPILSPLASAMRNLSVEETLPVNSDEATYRKIPEGGGRITVGDIAILLPN